MPGAVGRISSQRRRVVVPLLWPAPLVDGVDPTHPYVRAYWSAVMGTSAVADLLRLIAAARTNTPIPYPLFLHVLAAEGLAHHHGAHVLVHATVPPLGAKHVARLTPRLRRNHDADLTKALDR